MDALVNVLAFVFAVSIVIFSLWYNIRRAKKNGESCGCCGGKCSCGHDCKCKHK